jgi:fibronectin type 3 domain-containing protein
MKKPNQEKGYPHIRGFSLAGLLLSSLLMRNTPNNRKAWLVLLAALFGVMLSTNLHAANFLFFWSASTDPSVDAYGIYQRTGDSSYVMIDEVSVQDLDNPSSPSYLATGLTDGNTYWFAATSISASGTESDLSNQTCITVNGQVAECTDNDNNGATVFISCFITAAGH